MKKYFIITVSILSLIIIGFILHNNKLPESIIGSWVDEAGIIYYFFEDGSYFEDYSNSTLNDNVRELDLIGNYKIDGNQVIININEFYRRTSQDQYFFDIELINEFKLKRNKLIYNFDGEEYVLKRIR